MAASSILVSSIPGAGRLTPMHAASGIAMRQSPEKTRQLSGKSRQLSHGRAEVAERILAYLRQLYPFNMPLHVSRDTGIPRATIAKWEERGSAPDAEGIALLGAAYKAAFLMAVFGEAVPSLAVAASHERRARFQADQAAFEAEMAPLIGEAAP